MYEGWRKRPSYELASKPARPLKASGTDTPFGVSTRRLASHRCDGRRQLPDASGNPRLGDPAIPTSARSRAHPQQIQDVKVLCTPHPSLHRLKLGFATNEGGFLLSNTIPRHEHPHSLASYHGVEPTNHRWSRSQKGVYSPVCRERLQFLQCDLLRPSISPPTPEAGLSATYTRARRA
jgi:hypothetical protein